MGFAAVEGMPSLWWNANTRVLAAVYVDDLIAAGPAKACDDFWAAFRSYVTIDEVSEPRRFLGRDHAIAKAAGGKDVFLSMRGYCISAVGLYLKVAGDKPLKQVSAPYLDSELKISGWEAKGQLEEKSASILMKIPWLARLHVTPWPFPWSH